MFWLAMACDPTFRQVGPGTPLGPTTGTGGTGAGSLFVCDRRSQDGRCVEYTGPGWDDASRFSSCGNTPTIGSCPATTIGGCALADGTPLEYNEYYYEGDYYSTADATYLQGVCKLSYGDWL